MPVRVLFVEPDQGALGPVREALGLPVTVEGCSDFWTARARILSNQFDLLVANLRLGDYNGLHLVYLAQTSGFRTRAIVYTDLRDPLLGREVQAAGAFYETRDRCPMALRGYLHGSLPEKDRRSPASPDRRATFRGGRRSSDVVLRAS